MDFKDLVLLVEELAEEFQLGEGSGAAAVAAGKQYELDIVNEFIKRCKEEGIPIQKDKETPRGIYITNAGGTAGADVNLFYETENETNKILSIEAKTSSAAPMGSSTFGWDWKEKEWVVNPKPDEEDAETKPRWLLVKDALDNGAWKPITTDNATLLLIALGQDGLTWRGDPVWTDEITFDRDLLKEVQKHIGVLPNDEDFKALEGKKVKFKLRRVVSGLADAWNKFPAESTKAIAELARRAQLASEATEEVVNEAQISEGSSLTDAQRALYNGIAVYFNDKDIPGVEKPGVGGLMIPSVPYSAVSAAGGGSTGMRKVLQSHPRVQKYYKPFDKDTLQQFKSDWGVAWNKMVEENKLWTWDNKEGKKFVSYLGRAKDRAAELKLHQELEAVAEDEALPQVTNLETASKVRILRPPQSCKGLVCVVGGENEEDTETTVGELFYKAETYIVTMRRAMEKYFKRLGIDEASGEDESKGKYVEFSVAEVMEKYIKKGDSFLQTGDKGLVQLSPEKNTEWMDGKAINWSTVKAKGKIRIYVKSTSGETPQGPGSSPPGKANRLSGRSEHAGSFTFNAALPKASNFKNSRVSLLKKDGESDDATWKILLPKLKAYIGEKNQESEENLKEHKEKKDLTKTKLSYKMLVETIEEEMKLMETANTLGADVNEILMGYYAGGENWNIYGSQKGEVLKGLKQRKSQISPEEYADQDGRAKAQAVASLEWAAANGFDGKVVQTWWTARPGVLAKAVETEVDSRKNPTDTLYKFSSDAFLGVSAKSTKGKGDIGFKNPGIGRLGKELGVDLAGTAVPVYEAAVADLDWGGAKGTKERKQFLKNLAGGEKMNKVPALQPYYEAGTNVLKTLRDTLINYYLDMDIDELKEHFLEEWIDAKDRYPYYIKVTGHGKNGNYTASILDPIKNEKVKKISSEHIELEDIGSNSIGVWAGEGGDATKLFKIRLKWESAPLASSIKMSGDPF